MDGRVGGDTDTSIKGPILCCVSTREIRLDLHDGCEDSDDDEEAEEKGNPRLDAKKAAGTEGAGDCFGVRLRFHNDSIRRAGFAPPPSPLVPAAFFVSSRGFPFSSASSSSSLSPQPS